MRRLLIITVALCLLTLSASAWAGSGNHRIPPGQARHMVTHRTVVQGPGWGPKTMRRHAQWDHRLGHRHGQRFHRHSTHYVTRRCAPARRPTVVRERYIDRGSIQKYTIRIRTTD